MNSPEWLKKAVFYEIYPQSFQDGNNDGIGDFYGASKRLDYLSEMGFNAIWLNPMYESPFFDAGYDVTDYKKVAKRYGGNKAFLHFLNKAKEKGMHVILDLVPGHTSIDHKWFLESQKAKENEYTDRYIWNKNVWNCAPDCSWIRGFSERNGACMINFFSIQPKLNYGFTKIEHPEYEEPVEGKGPQGTINAMIDVIRYWLKLGVDGFRVDMAGWLVARDENEVGTQKVWKQVFSVIKKEFPESAFVSEWANPAHSLEAGFDMDFLLQDYHFDTFGLMSRYERPYFRYQEETDTAPKYFTLLAPLLEVANKNGHYLAMISGNHDTERLASWLNQEEAKLYYAFMLTMPSVPFFYYGDEIGMRYLGNKIPSVEGGYQRTGSRSPMQWDNHKKNAGFSNANKIYIPLDKHRKGISVEEQEKDSSSLLNFVKGMIKVKGSETALDNDASFHLIDDGKDGILIYERSKNNEKVRIYINAHGEEKTFKQDGSLLFSLHSALQEGTLTIGKQGVAIVKSN